MASARGDVIRTRSRAASPGVTQVDPADVGEHLPPEGFEEFFTSHEARLRAALVASLGPDRGREAAAAAMVYAWQHWARVRRMSSPLGYLFTVGRSRTRRMAVRGSREQPCDEWPLHAVYDDPSDVDLVRALELLTPRQRQCVVLVVGCQWTYRDAAESLWLTRSSVQRHVERATRRLRDLMDGGAP